MTRREDVYSIVRSKMASFALGHEPNVSTFETLLVGFCEARNPTYVGDRFTPL